MRKKLFLSAVLSLCCLPAFAQNETTWGPFENTSLWANWYVGADAGIQDVWGNGKLSPLRHNVDLQLGKWWSPFFATRLKAEMGRLKTNAKNSEYANRQFSSFVWHIDGEANLTNLFMGYRPDRFYNLKFLLGMGVEHTWGKGNESVNRTNRKATQMAMFAGIKNSFRLSSAFDLNFEVQGALMPKEIEGISSRGWRPHGQLSAMVGICYKFKPRGFKAISNQDCSRYTQRISQLERELNSCSQQNAQCQQELQKTRTALSSAQAPATGCATNPQPGQMPATCPAPNAGSKPSCACPGGKCACGCPNGVCTCGRGCKGAGTAPQSCPQQPMQNTTATYVPEMAVFFDINSTKIAPREELQLKLYADAIKAACCPYAVVGYADLQTGSKAYNEKLAMRRATAVVNILVQKYGVSPNLVKAQVGNLENPPFTDYIYNRSAIIKVP